MNATPPRHRAGWCVESRAGNKPAAARGIDISGFRLSDGRLISVLSDRRDPGLSGLFPRRVRDQGRRTFGHALGPDFNRDHWDHFHLDMGLWGPCR
jgi:hypothetical protein